MVAQSCKLEGLVLHACKEKYMMMYLPCDTVLHEEDTIGKSVAVN